MRKSRWKKPIKQSKKCKKGLCKETSEKTKSRSIKYNKCDSKKYIGKGYTGKEIIKTRIHMWDLKMNYRKREKITIVSIMLKKDYWRKKKKTTSSIILRNNDRN